MYFLFQDLAALRSDITSTNERLDSLDASVAGKFIDLNKHVDDIESTFDQRLQSEIETVKRNSEDSLRILEQHFKGIVAEKSEANSESEKKIQEATSTLEMNLAAQVHRHKNDFNDLLSQIHKTNQSLTDTKEGISLDITACRDDCTRSVERTTDLLRDNMKQILNTGLTELSENNARELSTVQKAVVAANDLAKTGFDCLEALEKKIKAHKDATDRLANKFHDAEEQRESWQRRVDLAGSSFRADIDAHLQQVRGSTTYI